MIIFYRRICSFSIKSTTFYYISNTRAKILKVAEELEYQANRVAKSLAGGKTYIIGFAISGFISPLFSTSFFSELIRGVGNNLEALGYNLLLFHPKQEINSNELYNKTIRAGFLDGIILEGNFIKDDFVLRLDEENFPYVLVGRRLIQKEVNYVTLDYFSGSFSAVNHIIKLGHKRIGFIGGPNIETMTNIMDRKIGYIHCLEENGIELVPDFVVHGENITYDEGYKLMQKILKGHTRPTAILAASDLLAIGAMNAIKESGLRVPDDIAVIGFDDMPEALMVRPRLTTVKFPMFDLGEASANMLIRILNEKEKDINKHQMLLPVELIVRESCGESPDFRT